MWTVQRENRRMADKPRECERLGGLDAEHDWASALSKGEQHLIAVSRLPNGERPRPIDT